MRKGEYSMSFLRVIAAFFAAVLAMMVLGVTALALAGVMVIVARSRG